MKKCPVCGVAGKLKACLDDFKKDWRRIVLRGFVGGALFVAGMWIVPHRWCARNAGNWYEGEIVLQKGLARSVEDWMASELSTQNFTTGYDLFDGEWLFGTYVMAGMGLGQTALEHQELRESHLKLMSTCIERILSPEVRAFDKHTWKNDPIETLDEDFDHAAYLGYFNLLLSLHRLLDSASEFADLNDRITDALARRLRKSPIMLLETYPSQVFPVDNCAVVGSIGLYDKATGADHGELIREWVARCRGKYVDAETGLLIQCVYSGDGSPADAPRGSGTAFGSYFLSFVDMELSRDLFGAIKKELGDTFLGFGTVKEYPRTIKGGEGDIDSGPLVMGYSVSATGFSLGCSRIHGDEEIYSKLFSTAYLFGSPLRRGDKWTYVTGGPLGNAIMFAMLTAGELPEGRDG